MTLWSYSSSLEESPTPESSSEAAEPSFSFSFLDCGFLLFRPGNGGTLVSGWRLASERSGFSFFFHFPPVVLSSLSPPSFATKYNSSSAFSAAQPLQGNSYTALVPGSSPPPPSLLPPQEPGYKVSSVDNWGQGT